MQTFNTNAKTVQEIYLPKDQSIIMEECHCTPRMVHYNIVRQIRVKGIPFEEETLLVGLTKTVAILVMDTIMDGLTLV